MKYSNSWAFIKEIEAPSAAKIIAEKISAQSAIEIIADWALLYFSWLERIG